LSAKSLQVKWDSHESKHMEITFIGYLLFVIPGFCFVWTYRHYTEPKNINDFEYAAWSFIWGTIIFLIFAICQKVNLYGIHTKPDPSISLDNPFSIIGSLLGYAIAVATIISFPLGYGAAYLFHRNFFRKIDKKLLDWIK
jgi:RsiW-degrading membrane proteinase PrsW (M82 family)